MRRERMMHDRETAVAQRACDLPLDTEPPEVTLSPPPGRIVMGDAAGCTMEAPF